MIQQGFFLGSSTGGLYDAGSLLLIPGSGGAPCLFPARQRAGAGSAGGLYHPLLNTTTYLILS